MTLKLYREMDNLVGRNCDSIADDFEASYQGVDIAQMAGDMDDEQHQAFSNIMFGSFVNGLIAAIAPESVFNKNYIAAKGETRAAETQEARV